MVDPIIFMLIAILGGSLGVKVTSTQNPVYSGLYLVLLFFLGSAISFLLGLEFMALLFLLVYAGAIAVLVLFVVMMLDVKAIENPWSTKKKRFLYACIIVILGGLLMIVLNKNFTLLIKTLAASYISSLVSFSFVSSNGSTNNFLNVTAGEWGKIYDIEVLSNFSQLWFKKEIIENSYGITSNWFVDFDSSCVLNDPSYLLYSTHAILLIIAGIVLLIAMVGAISLTLQKNCPESLYRQLGRESRNAIFAIKEKPSSKIKVSHNLEVLP